MKNYYEILEVNPKASMDIIHKVFKKKKKKWHPDLYQGEEKIQAEQKTKELTEAYETLSDEKKRAEYDEILEQNNNDSKLQNLMVENENLKNGIEKRDYIIRNLLEKAGLRLEEDPYDSSYEEEEEEMFDTQYDETYENYKQKKAEFERDYQETQNKNFQGFLFKIIVCFFIIAIGISIIYVLYHNLLSYFSTQSL